MGNLPTGILTTAPNMEFSYSYWSDDVDQKLKSGDIDLAFGYLPECPNHVKQHSLSRDELYFFCRQGHPLCEEADVSESALLKYSHIVVKNSGLDDNLYDRQLAAKGMRRNRIVTTPDLAAAFSLLKRTDYILLAPGKVANYLSPTAVRLPSSWFSQNVEYSLYWGAVKDQDNLHKYIREIIIATFNRFWSQQVG